MKITDIKTFPVWVGIRNQLVIKVETDEGIHGWGEAGLSGRELAVMGAIRHFREFLIGRDPRRTGALWQEMYRSAYFEGGRVLTAAISAIDIALYDITARSLGVPVYQLLGGKQRDYVDCFATIATDSESTLIDGAQRLLDTGWNVIRIGVAGSHKGSAPNVFEPRESIGQVARWLIRLREVIGLEPVLGVDYHHRLSVAETASFCQRLPSGTLDFLEEPVRAESPEAYAALRTMVDVPFAIGEEFSSKWAFLPYIERGLTNFVRLDVCNVGGLTESMKVAAMAEAHYIDVMPHNPLGPICTAATLHLLAAIPNATLLEVRASPTEDIGFYDENLFPVQPGLDGSRFPVPEVPGLGVEFDETLAHEQEFRFWEPPHLRREDGSHTNW